MDTLFRSQNKQSEEYLMQKTLDTKIQTFTDYLSWLRNEVMKCSKPQLQKYMKLKKKFKRKNLIPNLKSFADQFIYIYLSIYLELWRPVASYLKFRVVHTIIYIYIYIPLRKTKPRHIRIINLFPSWYGYWYESITPKLTGLLQI